jgi:hypothetical protein
LAHCFGMGDVFATGRTGKVDGEPAAGLTAEAIGPGGTMCVPICFLFAPAVATVSPRSGGGRRRFGLRGERIDHRRLRGGHGSMRGVGLG